MFRFARINTMADVRRILFASVVIASVFVCRETSATEGALGRPVAGTGVIPDAGVVSPEPITAISFSEIYLDGSIGGSKQVPIAGKTSLGIDGQVAFTLATLLKVWDTHTGAWNFASSITLPYVWTQVGASLGANARQASTSDRASNLFDLYFTPVIAGYHITKVDHIAFSFNIWAPTGQYDPNSLANPSLNNWTFVPQVAYTRIFPEWGFELDAVLGVQFYTRNAATDYQNAPLLTFDVMALKHLPHGIGAGLIIGTVQQLGNDSGPTADKLNGFRGHDLAIGPIVTYDTKLNGKTPLSLSARWVPTVSSQNRLKSTNTFMVSAAIAF
jgi:hypothetical protein